ncbi:hypothetical protein HII31_00612 [Pseudocercospora fuligena]|uniref:Uncharacterized protein n=1 Tax=Pseudocercospora fuligena TaxID=685502 RepID=A0A8H6RTS2_9PEZI|nr:hypothetical protein HII31_00612 [Pseudocercospora fuligena]
MSQESGSASSSSSQDSMEFTLDWVGIPQALTAGMPSDSWKTSDISIASPGGIDLLLQKVKALIIEKVKRHSSFTNGQARTFMLGLHTPAAGSTPAPNICPLIRFSTDISTESYKNGKQITTELISLDDWRRFSSVHDLSQSPDVLDKKELRLHVSLSIQPWKSAADVPSDHSLDNFVFPASSLTRYWQVGTVQTGNGSRFGLVDPDNGEKIPRQNAILARFEETNAFSVGDDFLVVPSSEFRKAGRRIGDCAAGKLYTLDWIHEKDGGNTKLFTDLERLTPSGGEAVLKNQLNTEFDDWQSGRSAGVKKKLPPLLPSLTLNTFDPISFGNNPTSFLPDTSTCNTVIRVVYHRDDVPDAAKAFPRNLQLPISSSRMTVAEMQRDMFATCGAQNRAADRLPDECDLEAKTECEWWIMPVSEQVEKMYRVDGGTVITNFIANVEDQSRRQVQMYMECHMRKVGEKGLVGL